MGEVWYFSYGWSMEKGLMKRCIGGWAEERRAELRGYRLVFNAYSGSWRGGVANLAEDEEGRVKGVVYRIREEQLAMIDRFEGVPSTSARMSVEVEVEGIGVVRAFTHIPLNVRSRWVKPSKEYLSAMLKGLKQHGYGEDVVSQVRKAAETH